AELQIRKLVESYAHPALNLRVRAFGGRRLSLIGALAEACRRRRFDRVMYALINQAVLSELPCHPPFDLWQIGTECFERLGVARHRAIRRASSIFSISSHTTRLAARHTPGLPQGTVVHPCAEPPDPEPAPYHAAGR